MDKQLLEKIIILDRTNIFEELLYVMYSMKPVSEIRVKEIASSINKKVGFELFKNFEYEILIKEFSIVSRAIQINALCSM